ncbi:aminotransferase class IV [Streptomyces sp. NPDC039016]|uniref:aminotransferase class IV n=1 Tax=Streptomyces sp. NPDC039016 TaxID=3154330 RepID=UPI0033E0E829
MDYLNGEPVGVDELKALALTNFGHFTTLRVDDGRVKGLSLHLDRLEADCRTVFDAALDRVRIRDLIRQAVDGRTGSLAVRVTAFDPGLGVARPGVDAEPRLLVTCRPVGDASSPLRVTTVAYQRELPEVKHVGLFGQLAARRAAQRAGFDDALFTEPDTGLLAEGATWNVAFIDARDRVVWPAARVLPGVTMRLLQAVHTWRRRPVPRTELPEFRAAFATNAAIGVRPLAAVDDVPLDTAHPMLDALRQRYLDLPDDRL